MEERYLRNLGPLTEAEQALLASKTVFLAGLGGLGGHLLEHMLRLGVGAIVAADGDRFTPSNLNRQLLATEDNLGQPKAQAAAERAAAVNPGVRITVVSAPLTAQNRDALLAGCDLALDGLDNLEARRILAAGCDRAGIPLVHGGIRDWCAQVAVIPPGSGLLDRIYPPHLSELSPNGTVSPVPAWCAAVQAAQALCLLCGRPAPLWGKLLAADLLHGEQEILPL